MTSPLWTLHELEDVLGLPITPGEDVAITDVHMDSRQVGPGTLFIALAGTDSHGHAYVPQAAENNAAVLLVEEKFEDVDVPQVLVPDSLEAMVKLAKYARHRGNARIMAVTGSCGKTTVKEFFVAALDAHGPEASFNNHVGVPLTLMRMPREAKFAVIEMGMNQKGEIAPLSEMTEPDVAIITTIQPVHTEGLGSIDGIWQEKLDVTKGMPKDAPLIVPPAWSGKAREEWPGPVLTFGRPDTDSFGEVTDKSKRDWDIHGSIYYQDVDFKLTDGSDVRLYNAVAALLSVHVLGGDVVEAAQNLQKVTVMPGRGTVHPINGITFVDDSFNANPASVRAAVGQLKNAKGRTFAILGDMLELGPEQVRYHQELAPVCTHVDGVFCVGPLMKNLYDALPEEKRLGHIESVENMDLAPLLAHFKEGDTVLLKGSKMMFWVYDFAEKIKAALANKE